MGCRIPYIQKSGHVLPYIQKIGLSEWRDIVHFLFPDAIVSHRTSISLRPEKGTTFLTRPTRTYRNYKLGPLTVSVTPGDVQTATRPIGKDLYASGDARACLENLSASRRRGEVPRALGQEALEAEFDKAMARKGQPWLQMTH